MFNPPLIRLYAKKSCLFMFNSCLVQVFLGIIGAGRARKLGNATSISAIICEFSREKGEIRLNSPLRRNNQV